MLFQLMTITYFLSQNIPQDSISQKVRIAWYTGYLAS